MELTALCAWGKIQNSKTLVAVNVRSWKHESVGQTEELGQTSAPIAWRSGGLRKKMGARMQHDPCRLSFFARRSSGRILDHLPHVAYALLIVNERGLEEQSIVSDAT
jgi:hypothetical protein